MRALVTWILRHRIAVVLLITALTGFLGFKAWKIQINTDFVTYLSDDSEVVQEFYRAGEVFESNYLAMVIFDPSDGRPLFSRENLTILSELTARYGDIDGVASVLSIANAADVKETPYGISIEDLVGTEIPEGRPDLDDLQSYVTAKELYRGILLDDAGESALLLLTFEPSADHMALAERVISQTTAANGSTEGFYFGGMPFVMYSMSQGIISNLSLLVPLILLFLIVVLYFAFRSLSGVIFPLLVVAVSAVWAVGILSLLDVPLDILTAIMPVILIAMGSADGIHLMKKYSEERRGGRRPTEAMRESVVELGVPILLTSVTTMVGFASLVVSDFRIIKTFGLAVTLAIFLALVVTIFFLPPLAALLSRKTGNGVDNWDDSPAERLMDRLSGYIHQKKKEILIAFGALTTIAVAGIPLITANVDWSLCLAKNSKPYAAEMMLRDRFGGSLPLQVSVKGDVKDPALLQTIQNIQEFAGTQPVYGC